MNFYQMFLDFIETFRIVSAKKFCQSLTFLFKGKLSYPTCFSILAICDPTPANAVLCGKINDELWAKM